MNSHVISTWFRKFRKSWIVLLGLLLLTLPLLRGEQVWGATIREINQTVPPPTPTRLPTAVPTASATPKPPEQPTAGPTSVSTPTSTAVEDNQATPAPPTQTSTPAPTTTKLFTGVVKSKTLNVRSGPGTSYSLIGVLPQNTKVVLQQQNEKGDWWFICCVPNTDIHGWVNSAFITPDSDLAEIKELLPINQEVPVTSSPTPSGTVTATTTVSNGVVAPEAGTTIQVTITQSPTFPLQGDLVTFQINITNPTTTAAQGLELRDELPMGMTIVEIVAAKDGTVSQDLTENLREVYSVTWPVLQAGASVTVTARVQIDAGLPGGAVLDNLAFAGSSNVPGSTAGLSLGMPPTDLPDFQ